jgi:hypothetical protein
MNDVILDSTLTCPYCGHAETEIMPTDARQFSKINLGALDRIRKAFQSSTLDPMESTFFI